MLIAILISVICECVLFLWSFGGLDSFLPLLTFTVQKDLKALIKNVKNILKYARGIYEGIQSMVPFERERIILFSYEKKSLLQLFQTNKCTGATSIPSLHSLNFVK